LPPGFGWNHHDRIQQDWRRPQYRPYILFPVFHFLFGVDAAHFEPWQFFMRKTGHVVGYFILSLLFFRAWRVTLASPNFPAGHFDGQQ
jgi:hypothetical protein